MSLTPQERQRRIKISCVLRSGAQCLLFSPVIWVGRRIEPNSCGVLPIDTWWRAAQSCMTCLKEGSPWELERGKALVIFSLLSPCFLCAWPMPAASSLWSQRCQALYTSILSSFSQGSSWSCQNLNKKSVALPAAFQLLYVLPQKSVLVCVSTSCVTLSSLGLDLFPFSWWLFKAWSSSLLPGLCSQKVKYLQFFCSFLMGFVQEQDLLTSESRVMS